jgi:hypothetical protein
MTEATRIQEWECYPDKAMDEAGTAAISVANAVRCPHGTGACSAAGASAGQSRRHGFDLR